MGYVLFERWRNGPPLRVVEVVRIGCDCWHSCESTTTIETVKQNVEISDANKVEIMRNGKGIALEMNRSCILLDVRPILGGSLQHSC